MINNVKILLFVKVYKFIKINNIITFSLEIKNIFLYKYLKGESIKTISQS